MRAVRLGDHATFLSGFAFKSTLFNEDEQGMPVIRIRDVVRGHSKTFYSGSYEDKYVVRQGEYLIGMDGEFNLARWQSEPALLNQRVCKVDGVSKDLDRDYLAKFLPVILKKIEDETPFVTVKHLSVKKLNEVQIPLPPLAEQKRIAAILDAADGLRAKRRESLAQLDTLLQSTFLNMFGDPVTNPKGWEVKLLGEIAASKPNNGIFRKNPEYSEGKGAGLPVVWVEELFRGNGIDTSSSRRLEATENDVEKYGLLYGDILFCRSSLKLDGIAFNNVFLGEDKEALFECHLIRVSPDTKVVSPMFLNFQLRSVSMRAVLKSKSKTATMTTIDQKALSSVELVVPPIELQRRFSTIVESVEKQKARLREHLAELDTLFASLQQRAFNGEL